MLVITTPPRGRPELLRLLVIDVLRQDADPAADHAAVIEDVLHDAAGQIHRNRKADALDADVAAVALVEHRGIDADQLAARIDQRAAGIAGIDGGIGLNEILEGGDAELTAAGGADDAMGHGLRQPERIADRQHRIADLQLIGAARAA